VQQIECLRFRLRPHLPPMPAGFLRPSAARPAAIVFRPPSSRSRKDIKKQQNASEQGAASSEVDRGEPVAPPRERCTCATMSPPRNAANHA